MISVENVNKRFPKYPITVEDKGWIYGVWYCGTAWQKSKIYGQYPPKFLERALALFPEIPSNKILHCPSGSVTGPGMTVDLIKDDVRCPQICASADSLPFANSSFKLWLADPPYSEEDAKKYGCKKFPLVGMVREAQRVLEPGGYLGVLHLYYPSYSRKIWELKALIAVITGFNRATRIFSILQKK